MSQSNPPSRDEERFNDSVEATVDDSVEEGVQNDDVIAAAIRTSLIVAIVAGIPLIGFLIYLNINPAIEASTESEVALPTTRVVGQIETPTIPLVPVPAEQSGIDFVHHSGKRGEKLLPETMGSGVAVLDYDNDGNLDLFFVNSTDWPWDRDDQDRSSLDGDKPDSGASCRLYRGNGQFEFTDVTRQAGLITDDYAMGVAIGDYDNDGDRDLYLTTVGPNRLFRNDDGVFVDVTDTAGVAGGDADWSTSTGFFDYDNDGYLDLFVCNYVAWNREEDVSQPFTLDGDSRAYGPPRAFAGSFSRLFRGGPDGTFRDVSADAGIEVRNSATGVPLGKAMGLTMVDVNTDGLLDLVVANDTVQNFLFLNRDGQRFDEVAAASGIAFDRASGNARGAMGIDAVSFRPSQSTVLDDAMDSPGGVAAEDADSGSDRDAKTSLAIGIGNFANEASALYMARDSGTEDSAPSFIDAAMYTGFGPPSRSSLTFGLFFWDADLDGRMDVFGANGHLEEEIAATQSSQSYAQPPQMFWNAGREASSELRMVAAECVGEGFCRPVVGRGAAYGDFDNDGDQDVVMTTSDGPPVVLRNQQSVGHHYLRIRVLNRFGGDAIGATAEVTAGTDRHQTIRKQTVMPTKSYLSQCEPTLTFGLGDVTQVKSVVVRYHGQTRRLSLPDIDQTVTVRFGDDAV